MAALAVALVRQGCRVVYVVEREMSEERARMGWRAPEMPGVSLRLAGSIVAMTQAADVAPPDAVHICQGLRGNGLVGVAQRRLRRRRARQWVVMEKLAGAGLAGALRRLLYRGLFLRWRHCLDGVLAIGAGTCDWVVARGMPAGRVFPFAYFLSSADSQSESSAESKVSKSVSQSVGEGRRLLFVGQLIHRKRVDLLFDALARLNALPRIDFQLEIIGDGPQAQALQMKASQLLQGRVTWLGNLPMTEVRQRMALADCLVLPSNHDGWGAVVSEALIAGTPAICSDACGVADVVRASGKGGVFPAGDRDALEALLYQVIKAGSPSEVARQELAAWSAALTGDAGAAYLLKLLGGVELHDQPPSPPWWSAKEVAA